MINLLMQSRGVRFTWLDCDMPQKFIHSKVESVSCCHNKYQIPFCIPACVVSNDFFTIACLYLVRLKYLRIGKSISETLITPNHKKTKLVEI